MNAKRRPCRDARRRVAIRSLLSFLKEGDAVGGTQTDITLGSARVFVFHKLEGDARRPIPNELISDATCYQLGKRGVIIPVPDRFRIRRPPPYGWGSPVEKTETLVHAIGRISLALFGRCDRLSSTEKNEP